MIRYLYLSTVLLVMVVSIYLHLGEIRVNVISDIPNLLKKETMNESSPSTSFDVKGKMIDNNGDGDNESTSIRADPGMNVDPNNTLIDFAIAGFPKCGTTFLRNGLLNTNQFFYGNGDNENHLLRQNHVEAFKDLFHTGIEKNREGYAENAKSTGNSSAEDDGGDHDNVPLMTIKRGFKCPDLLYSHVGLSNIEKHFPHTDFIVSVRHPVLWFQSFYNYRLRKGYRMPHPNQLIGACPAPGGLQHGLDPLWKSQRVNRAAHKVCTDNANFHFALSRLGKTPMESRDEKSLLHHQYNASISMSTMRHYQFFNRIFLMELGQLSVKNETRADKFVRDLEIFLGLDTADEDIKNRNSSTSLQGKNATNYDHLPKLRHHDPPHRVKNNANMAYIQNMWLDICSQEHDALRFKLIQIGRESSTWIQRYFMASDDVIVSDEQHFRHLLDFWKEDPCDKARKNTRL